MPFLRKTSRPLPYYLRNIARDAMPQTLFRRSLSTLCDGIERHDQEVLSSRLNYYNRLSEPERLDQSTSTVGTIPMEKSRYYYDLKEHARYFPRHLRLEHLFGDVTIVPERPTIVKSRPISNENRTSVLLPLDKLRHFRMFRDPCRFEDKMNRAVWRGANNNAKRMAMVDGFHDHPLCDVGFSGGDAPRALRKAFLPPARQMAYRYIISVEGNDVGTNLKWILASQSLCIMPQPAYETWFMEGRLQPGIHYVRVQPDFSDLVDKIDYYERNRQAAFEIVQNANAFVSQFANRNREQLLSVLVLYKYFVRTEQTDAPANVAALWERSGVL